MGLELKGVGKGAEHTNLPMGFLSPGPRPIPPCTVKEMDPLNLFIQGGDNTVVGIFFRLFYNLITILGMELPRDGPQDQQKPFCANVWAKHLQKAMVSQDVDITELVDELDAYRIPQYHYSTDFTDYFNNLFYSLPKQLSYRLFGFMGYCNACRKEDLARSKFLKTRGRSSEKRLGKSRGDFEAGEGADDDSDGGFEASSPSRRQTATQRSQNVKEASMRSSRRRLSAGGTGRSGARGTGGAEDAGGNDDSSLFVEEHEGGDSSSKSSEQSSDASIGDFSGTGLIETVPRELLEKISKVKFYVKISTRHNLAYFADYTRKFRCKNCLRHEFIARTLPPVLTFINSAEERLRDVLPVMLYSNVPYGLYAVVSTQFRDYAPPRVFLYQANERARSERASYMKYASDARKPLPVNSRDMLDILAGDCDVGSVISYLFYVRVESMVQPYKGPVDASIRSLLTPETEEQMWRLDGQDVASVHRVLRETGGKNNEEEVPASAIQCTLCGSTETPRQPVQNTLGITRVAGYSPVVTPMARSVPGSVHRTSEQDLVPSPATVIANTHSNGSTGSANSGGRGAQDADPFGGGSVYIDNSTGNLISVPGESDTRNLAPQVAQVPLGPVVPGGGQSPPKGNYAGVTVTDDELLTTMEKLQEVRNALPPPPPLPPGMNETKVITLSTSQSTAQNGQPSLYGPITSHPRKKFEVVKFGASKTVVMRSKKGEISMPLWLFILIIVLGSLSILFFILVVTFGALWSQARASQGSGTVSDPSPAPVP